MRTGEILGPNGKPFVNPHHPIAKVYADEREPHELTKEEWFQAQRNLDHAFFRTIVNFPFFGRIATYMAQDKVWVTENTHMGDARGFFRTMAVDGKRMYIWPQFALYLPKEILTGIILHELYHCLFLHPARGMGFDPALANVAMDYSVNLHVNDAALEHAQSSSRRFTIDDYKSASFFVPIDEGFMYDERFRTKEGHPMLWEEIYQLLLKEQPPDQQQRIANGEGIDAEALAKYGQGLDNHGAWRPGNRPADAEGDVNNEAFDVDAPARWVLDAMAATSENENRGFIPGGLKRKIDELLNPPIPWFLLLSNYTEPTPGDIAWVPGDLRFDDPMPWYVMVPDLKTVVLSFDTSGSMSDLDIGGCLYQAQAMLDGFPNLAGRAFFWDAKVHDRFDLKDWHGGNIPREFGGGGGTSIVPQFKAIEQEELTERVKVVVTFTDFYVDTDRFQAEIFPKLDDGTYGFDILVVICNDQDHALPAHPRVKYTRFTPHA